MRKFQKLMLSHRCVCMCADLHPHAYQQKLKWTRKQKKPHRVLQKKQPSTGNHRDTLLTPATPNFNVVIGSAEHHQQKWLFFLKAAKHKIQKTTLNWGTGEAWPLWCGTSWDGCFFWRTRYHSSQASKVLSGAATHFAAASFESPSFRSLLRLAKSSAACENVVQKLTIWLVVEPTPLKIYYK